MSTISFSTAYVSKVTNSLTAASFTPSNVTSSPTTSGSVAATTDVNNIVAPINTFIGSFFSYLVGTSTSNYYSNPSTYYQGIATILSSTIYFKNSSGDTLVSYTVSELARTMDANGYVVISNFPPKTPSLAGTISSIELYADTQVNNKTITFTAGAGGGSADIQFDDRVLVTTQPWRLDGSIKFRIPVSYEYTL
jgi:hypothetical protein